VGGHSVKHSAAVHLDGSCRAADEIFFGWRTEQHAAHAFAISTGIMHGQTKANTYTSLVGKRDRSQVNRAQRHENKLDTSAESGNGSMIETLKKQKRGNTQNARSAAAAMDSPCRAP
jgi:hypothetical protein